LSPPIDEHTAWELLRMVSQRMGAKSPHVRIQHDPNPDVWLQVYASGKWEASTILTDEALQLLELFLPLQLQNNLVIAQIGQSLDGRSATATGQSHYVTGPVDIRRLHRLRALVDAVVVGATTVAADNPRLTVREVTGENPLRVILDPNGRLDQQKHVFSDGAASTLHVKATPNNRNPRPQPHFVGNSLLMPATDGFDPKSILEVLHDQGYKRILIEGGGNTVSRFLQADAVDRLHITVAPLLIGSGQVALMMDPIESLDQALRPTCRHFRLGRDILFDLNLRQQASSSSTSVSRE